MSNSIGLSPMFKGVWYAAVHFALWPLRETRPDQCRRPRRRAEDGPGCHGPGGLSVFPTANGTSVTGAKRAKTTAAVGVAVGPLFPGTCRAWSRRYKHTCRWMTAYTSNPTTVSMAKAAIRSGFSSHTADGDGILDPAKPWFYGDMLLLISLEYLGICAALCPHGGRQDGPALRVGGRHVGLCLAPEAITDAVQGLFCLGGTASLRAFLPLCDRFYLVMEGMVTPGPRLAPTPPLATAFVLGNGGLRIGGTGKPAGFDTRDMLCDLRSFLRLGCGIRDRRLVGQLAGVDHQKAEFCHLEASVSIFHFHPTDDTLPIPASRRLLPGPTRFFEQ